MDFIKRKVEKELQAHLKKKEITLLIGPRQVGKSTLLYRLKEELEKSGEKTVFFNLDREEDRRTFESQLTVLANIELYSGGQKCFVFIDEIQRKENAGLFLKGLYDRDLPYKYIVSGSGSLELKEKVVESLAGRKRIFEITPISFWEFIDYRTNYQFSDRLETYADLHPEEIQHRLEEYLIFGGYPEAIKATTTREKALTIEEVYRSYIDRDINAIINIDKPNAFETLMRLLAIQIGLPLNYSYLAKKTGLSSPTVQKYIWYLEKTYIIKLVWPFFTNPVKEISKAPVLYFNDLGMRSYLRRTFNFDPLAPDLGFVFQNFIFLQLFEKATEAFTELKYWRTKDKAEVDFVLDQFPVPIPFEVKYSNSINHKINTSLRNYIKQYKPRCAYLISRSLQQTIMIQQTEVRWIPYWKTRSQIQ